MITLRTVALAALAATLVLGTAACKGDPTTSAGAGTGASVPSGTPQVNASASASASASTSAPASVSNAGASGACVAGNWVSTGVLLDIDSGLAGAKGGAGVHLSLTPAGAMTVRFNGMKPITYTASTGGVAGSFTYGGTAHGTIVMPPAGTSSGTWQVKQGEFRTVTARVRITRPVAIDLGTLKLDEMAKAFGGTSGGSSAGAKPFAAQKWTCSGGTMQLRSVVKASKGSVDVGWTMARA